MTLRPSAGLAAARMAALALLGLGCAACSEEYLARRDTLSPSSGDAVKADVAIQTIDPRSRNSQQTSLTFNGEQLQHAVESYRNPSAGPANSGLANPGLVNPAPPAPTIGGATALH